MGRHCFAQVVDVCCHILRSYKRHRTHARAALEGLLARKDRHALAELRIVLQIQRNLAGIVAFKAGQAVLDVGRIADFGRLAIADEVDAGSNLAGNDLIDCLCHDDIERRLRIGLPLFPLKQHFSDRRAARQTSDMGGVDP